MTDERDWYVDCHEVSVPYLNKSISCGRGGRKFGKLTSLVGHGFFNQEIPAIPCSDCDEELFQWTSWSRVGDRRQRKRGSQSVGDSYEEEKRIGESLVFNFYNLPSLIIILQ